MTTITTDPARASLMRTARALALVTIAYNVIEGVVSISLGISDETLSLLGFGVDSLVEVISGIGIYHMLTRPRRSGDAAERDSFERTALRITGACFFLLALGLGATAVINLLTGARPETTLWGIVIAVVSIAAMAALIRMKLGVGRRLDSPALIADAHCTRACLLFSVVLLAASGVHELTGLAGVDAAGALLIAALCVKEGREAFAKARGAACGSCGCHG